ncbi:hypothetical protein TRFO_10305 [Tritrichomonas foetus]|uniref:Uncharacterized protein n=1 Tax=Tritrichomonas foetus TaxID=1144522 RepID=A0A1J4JEM8_9EUKA|nr:hypothetical protein TRFO_10305 [Tritrichomonas foetus]|eukprot:OHS95893.1 hypothetical protein TRFO_10305 [Tritrichomonas foetus]
MATLNGTPAQPNDENTKLQKPETETDAKDKPTSSPKSSGLMKLGLGGLGGLGGRQVKGNKMSLSRGMSLQKRNGPEAHSGNQSDIQADQSPIKSPPRRLSGLSLGGLKGLKSVKSSPPPEFPSKITQLSPADNKELNPSDKNENDKISLDQNNNQNPNSNETNNLKNEKASSENSNIKDLDPNEKEILNDVDKIQQSIDRLLIERRDMQAQHRKWLDEQKKKIFKIRKETTMLTNPELLNSKNLLAYAQMSLNSPLQKV